MALEKLCFLRCGKKTKKARASPTDPDEESSVSTLRSRVLDLVQSYNSEPFAQEAYLLSRAGLQELRLSIVRCFQWFIYALYKDHVESQREGGALTWRFLLFRQHDNMLPVDFGGFGPAPHHWLEHALQS